MSSLNLKLFRRSGVTFVEVAPGNVVKGKGFPSDELDLLNQALQQRLPSGSRVRQSFPHTLERLRAINSVEPNLAFWLRVSLPDGTSESSAHAIASDLRGAAPVLERADVAPRFEPSQTRHLLESGHGGIGAEAAWQIEGGTGTGVSVGLVDAGYQDTNWLPTLELHGAVTKSWDPTHGSLCAGIVLGDPASGAPGIAYEAAGHLSPIIDGDLPVAIDAMQQPGQSTGARLDQGDVVWIAQEIAATGDPVEWDPSVRDLLKALTKDPPDGLGIVVVIAAGNADYHEHTLPVSTEDSEAIVVGAGGSGTVPGHPAQQRVCGNYGPRVDCQAWGEDVVAVGETGLETGVKTSAACSMVAGIAAVVESVAKSCSRGPISPTELRAALQTPALGLLCQGPEPIGPLPDIWQVLDHFELVPDSFLRDHVGDTGAEPSDPTQAIWASPDIIPRLQVEADPQGTLGGANWDLDLGESPVQGTTCQLYLRLQNRSFVGQDVRVNLYWAYQGAWISPSAWHQIGSIAAHSPGRDYTGAGSPERVVVGPLAWATPTDTTHPCLIAVLQSGVDPVTIPGPMTDDVAYAAFVRDHNNVTHRNITLGEATLQPLMAWAFNAHAPKLDGPPVVLRPVAENLGGARAFLGLGGGRVPPPHGPGGPLRLEELAGPNRLGAEPGTIRKAFDERRVGDRRSMSLPDLWIPIHEGGDFVLEDVSPGDTVPLVVLLRAPEDRRITREIRIVQCRGEVPIGAVSYRFGPRR